MLSDLQGVPQKTSAYKKVIIQHVNGHFLGHLELYIYDINLMGPISFNLPKVYDNLKFNCRYLLAILSLPCVLVNTISELFSRYIFKLVESHFTTSWTHVNWGFRV